MGPAFVGEGENCISLLLKEKGSLFSETGIMVANTDIYTMCQTLLWLLSKYFVLAFLLHKDSVRHALLLSPFYRLES